MLLDTTLIRDYCDYSFGDESGHKLPGGYMRPANRHNREFIRAMEKVKAAKKPYMTLFIDNIRLYRRPGIRYTAVEQVREDWKKIKDQKVKQFADQDLLELCRQYPKMKFVIFTGFDDTPIDEEIFSKIPENVLAVYGTNAQAFGGKVIPVPYGLQRRLGPTDDRFEVLQSMISTEVQPTKMLYINYSVHTNPQRKVLNNYFSRKHWATIKSPKSIRRAEYFSYLKDIKRHKFVLCPSGNAIGCDCHRDWETLYMKRVPVVEWSPYKEEVFRGFPVLFVEDFLKLKESDLKAGMHLLKAARELDPKTLDMSHRFRLMLDQVNQSLKNGTGLPVKSA